MLLHDDLVSTDLVLLLVGQMGRYEIEILQLRAGVCLHQQGQKSKQQKKIFTNIER